MATVKELAGRVARLEAAIWDLVTLLTLTGQCRACGGAKDTHQAHCFVGRAIAATRADAGQKGGEP